MSARIGTLVVGLDWAGVADRDMHNMYSTRTVYSDIADRQV